MPRKAMKCIVELDIHAVTCPGTFLRDYGYVYLKVNCMGLELNSKSVAPTFPLFFHERLRFERTFRNCQDPAYVSVLLKGEDVLIELRQHDDYISDGYVIGHYANNARDFLYPAVPPYPGTGRELTLFKTSLFNPIRITGMPIKLEFATKTTIKEVPDPDLYSSSPRRSRSPTRRPRSTSPSRSMMGSSMIEPLPSWKYNEDFPRSPSRSRKHYRSSTEPLSLSQSYRSSSPSRSLHYALDDLDLSSSSKNYSDPLLRFKTRYSPNLKAALSASDRIQSRVEKVLDKKDLSRSRSDGDSDVESVDSLDVLRESLREERRALSDAIREADRAAYYKSLGIDI